MKKSFLAIGLAAAASLLALTGCTSTSSAQEEIAKLDNFIKGSRALERVEPIGHAVVDPLNTVTGVTYFAVGGEMRDYIEKKWGGVFELRVYDKVIADAAFEKALAAYLQDNNDADAKTMLLTAMGQAAEELAATDAQAADANDPAKKEAQLQALLDSAIDKYGVDLVKHFNTIEDPAQKEEFKKNNAKLLELGAKRMKAKYSKLDTARRKARFEQLKADLQKQLDEYPKTLKALQDKVALLTGQVADLTKELAPLQAEKKNPFAKRSSEEEAELDKKIAEAEKAIDPLKKALEEEKAALVFLGEKVWGRLEFTGRAIPFMIDAMGDDEELLKKADELEAAAEAEAEAAQQ